MGRRPLIVALLGIAALLALLSALSDSAALRIVGIVLSTAGAALVVFLGLRRPLDEMTEAARALAEGREAAPMPLDPPHELERLGQAFRSLAEELRRRGEEARAELSRLQAVLGAMEDGVIALGADGRVELTNDSARRMLQLRAESRGDELWQLIRDDRVVAVAKEALAGRESHASIEREGLVLTISAAPVASGRAVLVIRDDTRRHEYDRLRREFVANVSHELRTPLTFIRGFVETLRAGALDDRPKAEEFLATIDRHAGQLDTLIRDLLELSRLESQPGLLKRRRTRLDELADRVRRAFAPLAERRRQALTVEAGPVEADIDPDLAERALGNLVDNAIKYTPEGGTITIAVGAPAVLEVRDTGSGIPAADLSHVFERFYRVEKSRSREGGGTGLGLAIVKHIAQLHGGSVVAHSTVDQGSTFRLNLGV